LSAGHNRFLEGEPVKGLKCGCRGPAECGMTWYHVAALNKS